MTCKTPGCREPASGSATRCREHQRAYLKRIGAAPAPKRPRRESNEEFLARRTAKGLPGLTVYALAEKLRGFVCEAARAGFAVIVDSDRIAIRLVSQKLVDSGADLRDETLGSAGVRVHGACGGGGSRRNSNGGEE